MSLFLYLSLFGKWRLRIVRLWRAKADGSFPAHLSLCRLHSDTGWGRRWGGWRGRPCRFLGTSRQRLNQKRFIKKGTDWQHQHLMGVWGGSYQNNWQRLLPPWPRSRGPAPGAAPAGSPEPTSSEPGGRRRSGRRCTPPTPRRGSPLQDAQVSSSKHRPHMTGRILCFCRAERGKVLDENWSERTDNYPVFSKAFWEFFPSWITPFSSLRRLDCVTQKQKQIKHVFNSFNRAAVDFSLLFTKPLSK